jgi:Ca-activated chloride channel family protein
MEWTQRLALEQPAWLWLIAVPWLLAWRMRDAAPARLRRFADPHLIAWLIHSPNRSTVKGWKRYRTALAASLTILALGGPILTTRDADVLPVRQVDVALIVDISPSMTVTDVPPDRLARAKLELQAWLPSLTGTRIGLIAYSGNAYTLLPLTADRAALAEYIDALDSRLTRRQGSNLVQALQQARQLLTDTPRGARAIILVSDGATPDAAEVARSAGLLRSAQIPVFAFGVGTMTGGPVPDGHGSFLSRDGQTLRASLDENGLERLADVTRGRYAELSAPGALDVLRAGLQDLPGDRNTSSDTGQSSRMLYYWPLAVGLLLFLWDGPRRHAVATLLAIGCALPFAPDVLQAAPWREQNAYDALLAGRNAEAADRYRDIDNFNARIAQGVIHYRDGKWDDALDAFRAAAHVAVSADQRAAAAYNTGNALAHLHRFEEARQAYKEALRERPNFPHAALNMSLIDEARKLAAAGHQTTVAAPPTAATTGIETTVGRTPQRANTPKPRALRASPPGPESWPAALARIVARDEQAGLMLRYRVAAQDALRGGTPEDAP